MLAEQVLTCGRDGLSNSLAALCGKYLNIDMDKSTRDEFIGMEGKPFTAEQIEYGAKDVKHLINIRGLQFPHIQKYGLEPVLQLENEATLAFADIEFNGLTLDKEKWLEIAKTSEHKALTSSDGLDAFILEHKDTFDEFINYNVQGNLFDSTPDQEIKVSWDSPKQVLNVFQTYGIDIEDVNAKNLYKHIRKYPIIKDYIKYKETMKLATSYGEGFFKYLKGDGRIHTNFKQILNTGRVASSEPNMQQIPADNKYRNCFIAENDQVFVSGDYSSQELCVIAYGSQDPVWLQALEKGEDLHSVCAELVYGKVWEEAADDDCAYYAPIIKQDYLLEDGTLNYAKQKCDCSAHKKLRTGVKTINFGLAYGMSKFKLADTLLISEDEAEKLITDYFKAFPKIKGFLDLLGQYGVRNGHIKTFAPYRRIRFFDAWDPLMDKKTLGDIERASKNTPIQGTSADMTKRAMVLVRRAIIDENLPVKMVMTVHDQIDTICSKEYGDTWRIRLTELMEQAALEIIDNGLLKAEVEITDVWSK